MIPLPDIEKFMPAWVCFGSMLFGFVAFITLLIVLATSRRSNSEEGTN